MKNIVLSFFDYTGEAVKPWADAGFECHCFDIQHEAGHTVRHGKGSITFHHWDALQPFDVTPYMGRVAMVFGFPPCTDLASSGALHWAKKREANPRFQEEAADMAIGVMCIARELDAPFCIENPNGALSTLWRKADHSFDPCDFGGYLSASELHPTWPEYIPAQDAYTKRTRIWSGNGFRFPTMDAVEPILVSFTKKDGTVTKGSPQWAKLGGKSLKTKNIRSATPRGFAKAVYLANGFPTLLEMMDLKHGQHARFIRGRKDPHA